MLKSSDNVTPPLPFSSVFREHPALAMVTPLIRLNISLFMGKILSTQISLTGSILIHMQLPDS